MKYHTTIRSDGNNTGIDVPPEILEALSAGKKPPVRVTLNGYTYRNTVATVSGRYVISLSKEHRTAAGVAGGDSLDVEVKVDTTPREVEVPEDFQAALDADPAAKQFFEGLSYSNKSRNVLAVTGAKSADTRARRIEKAIENFREGKA
jgi:hypothetical protein